MPRTRHPRTRVQILAEALEAAQVVSERLAEINLSTTSPAGDLRKHIKTARELSRDQRDALLAALRLDVPEPVTAGRSRSA